MSWFTDNERGVRTGRLNFPASCIYSCRKYRAEPRFVHLAIYLHTPRRLSHTIMSKSPVYSVRCPLYPQDIYRNEKMLMAKSFNGCFIWKPRAANWNLRFNEILLDRRKIGETFNPYLTTRFYIEHILSILHKFFVEIDTCLILSILLHRSLLRLDESQLISTILKDVKLWKICPRRKENDRSLKLDSFTLRFFEQRADFFSWSNCIFLPSTIPQFFPGQRLRDKVYRSRWPAILIPATIRRRSTRTLSG